MWVWDTYTLHSSTTLDTPAPGYSEKCCFTRRNSLNTNRQQGTLLNNLTATNGAQKCSFRIIHMPLVSCRQS